MIQMLKLINQSVREQQT